MEFQTENYFQLVRDSDFDALIRRHWDKIALNQDTIPLEPNWDMYKALAEAGRMHITTAREDGRLVGYVIYLMGPNLHYKSWPIADGDIFWMDEEHRKGLTGMKMLRAAEEGLKAKGIKMIINKVKLHRDIGPVFKRLGYNPIERVYSKVLN